MPDNLPMNPGVQAIMRARGLVDRGLSAARNYGTRQLTGLRNAIPGTQNWDWRQTLDAATNTFIPGDWYNSATGRWQNPLTGNPWGQGNAQPLQPGQVPHANMPAADPTAGAGWAPAQMPGQLPQGQGPLRSYALPPGQAVRGGRLRGQSATQTRAQAQDAFDAMRGTDPYARFSDPEISPNNPRFKER